MTNYNTRNFLKNLTKFNANIFTRPLTKLNLNFVFNDGQISLWGITRPICLH